MAPLAAHGRLADPDMSLGTDPRVHPKLYEVLKDLGLLGSFVAPDIPPDAPLDAVSAFLSKTEEQVDQFYCSLDCTLPDETTPTPLTKSEESVPGPDGNAVKLIINRPANSVGAPLPAILYFHGGGMVLLRTENPLHMTWVEALARTGVIAIAVDFRNVLTSAGQPEHPFPAGLNDCAAAVRWVNERREQLGITKLVLQGESGGANLAFATTLKAKREGWLDAIDGVCGFSPFLSGAYGSSKEWKLRELPSLVECDGYFVGNATQALGVRVYDPSEENARNPLAWPYWATEDDLRGLPPHLVITNELDALKDEGNAYYRKLVKAGVRAVGKMNLGIIHAGEIILRQPLAEVFKASLSELRQFIDRL